MTEQTEPQPQKKEYQWVNRNEYPHGKFQELGDKIASKPGEGEQQKCIFQLFQRTQKQSSATLLHLDDDKKQMHLFTLPTFSTKFKWSDRQVDYTTLYSDIRNRFVYMTQIGYQFGQKGSFLKLSAFSNRSQHRYSFNFNVKVKERLDNSFACDRFLAAFCYYLGKSKFIDNGTLSVYRQSRQNYLSFFNKQSQKKHKFGLKEPDSQLSKQSNLLALAYRLDKSIFTLNGSLGLDASNKQYFKSLKLKVAKGLSLGDSFQLLLGAELANMWGANIVKEDMFKRHFSQWPGSRSKNYVSAAFELQFKNFPYLNQNYKSYIYGQSWAIFNQNQAKAYDTRFQVDYGIGVSSNDGRFNFLFSLFKYSRERKMGVFGPVKFSF